MGWIAPVCGKGRHSMPIVSASDVRSVSDDPKSASGFVNLGRCGCEKELGVRVSTSSGRGKSTMQEIGEAPLKVGDAWCWEWGMLGGKQPGSECAGSMTETSWFGFDDEDSDFVPRRFDVESFWEEAWTLRCRKKSDASCEH